ncbi:alpha-ketoglutarate transporter [Salmonella enterica subsp. enterica serovar Typhimurium]|nr:alpha-ketoglutarate transporter [Salmonella enterica subsp. enterica serovar Typhimurium]
MAEIIQRIDKNNAEAPEMRRRIWAIVGASSGNLVEWFDFYVYSFCSLYFAHIFFPSGNTTTQLLQTAGVFAAGFLMRPIGGWLFGRIADRRGRKASMLISVCMMCMEDRLILEWFDFYVYSFCSLYFAHIFFPSGNTTTQLLQTAGVFAAGFLMRPIGGWLFGRIADRRGRKASMLISVCMMCMEDRLIYDAELRAWGWRIPFALGAVLAVVALWLRRQLDETSKHETRALKEAGSLKGLWRNRKAFLMVLGFTAAGSLCFYTFTTYMQKYLVNTAGMHANVASGIMTAALCVFMLVQPLFGALSDKIGRRTSMLCFGALATLFTVPILSALQNVTSPYAAFALVICALLIVSFYTSISGILKAEMFPAQVRALGVGLSYAVANALFGGSAEYVALSLKSVGMESSFFWYVTAMAVLAFLVSLMLHRKGKGLRL